MALVTPQMRLRLIGVAIFGSILYATLVAHDESLARTIMIGYIGLVLTIFLLVELWKRPHDR